MGMPGFGAFVIVEVGCELLDLLEACVTLRLTLICCVSDDALLPIASLSGVWL
jgi:hypothetical protein